MLGKKLRPLLVPTLPQNDSKRSREGHITSEYTIRLSINVMKRSTVSSGIRVNICGWADIRDIKRTTRSTVVTSVRKEGWEDTVDLAVGDSVLLRLDLYNSFILLFLPLPVAPPSFLMLLLVRNRSRASNKNVNSSNEMNNDVKLDHIIDPLVSDITNGWDHCISQSFFMALWTSIQVFRLLS